MEDIGSVKIPAFANHKKWKVINPYDAEKHYNAGQEILVSCKLEIMLQATRRVVAARGWGLFQKIVTSSDTSLFSVEYKSVYDFIGEYLGVSRNPKDNGMERFFFIEDKEIKTCDGN